MRCILVQEMLPTCQGCLTQPSANSGVSLIPHHLILKGECICQQQHDTSSSYGQHNRARKATYCHTYSSNCDSRWVLQEEDRSPRGKRCLTMTHVVNKSSLMSLSKPDYLQVKGQHVWNVSLTSSFHWEIACAHKKCGFVAAFDAVMNLSF